MTQQQPQLKIFSGGKKIRKLLTNSHPLGRDNGALASLPESNCQPKRYL